MDDLTAWLQSHGLDVSQPILDGEFHRVAASKPKSKSGWYIGWTDPVTVCVIGDWRTGMKAQWKEKGRALDAAEAKRAKEKIKEARAQREKDVIEKQEAARVQAASMLDQAKWFGHNSDSAPITHAYLERKGVHPFGIALSGNALLIPTHDIDGTVWGVQRIFPDGSKFFLKGQRTKKAMFRIGPEPTEEAILCEGYSTGATLHEITGLPVFCAFNAYNMLPVAEDLRGRYQTVAFTVAADNDQYDDSSNPGLTRARSAARRIGAALAWPEFRDTSGKPTDFNDLFAMEGRQAVLDRLDQKEAANTKGGALGAKDKLPEGVIEQNLCDVLDGRDDFEFTQKAGPFPHEFRVVRPESGGAPIILKIENNTASIESIDYAAGHLRQYVSNFRGPTAMYNLPYRKCKAVVESWAHQRVDYRELPKPVGFATDPELCLSRLSFDPVRIGSEDLERCAPLFSEMLSRMTNAEAFAMRLGSIYDKEADRKQAVWMWGPADCGKSDVAWLVQELSGGSYGLLSQDDLKTSYWKAQIVGKRVGIVNEAAAKFIRGDQFKAITGDGDHSINQKNEKIYNARIDALIFAFSNQAPEIPHDDALMQRVIACHIDAVPEEARLPRHEVHRQLEDEMPYVAGYCIELYEKGCSADGRIPNTKEGLQTSIDNYEADYLEFLDEYFIEDPDACVRRDAFRTAMDIYGFKRGQDQQICKRVMRRRFNAEEKRNHYETNEHGVKKQVWVIRGLRWRSEKERQYVERQSADKHLQLIKGQGLDSKGASDPQKRT